MMNELMRTTSQAIAHVLPSWATESELVGAIKRDHEDLKKLLAVLKNERKALSTKRKAFPRFAALLESHSDSEKTAVYDAAMEYKSLRKDTFEGEIEHEVAASLLERIHTVKKPEKWAAMVKVLAELVEHHIQEEERDYLPELDRVVPTGRKLQMEARFLELRRSSQSAGADSGVLASINH